MITDGIYKWVALVLLVLLLACGTFAYMAKQEIELVKKDNTALTGKVATLNANLVVQNQAVEKLTAKTEAYQESINKANLTNRDLDQKLQISLAKIQKLKVPAKCDDKITFLNQRLRELSK